MGQHFPCCVPGCERSPASHSAGIVEILASRSRRVQAARAALGVALRAVTGRSFQGMGGLLIGHELDDCLTSAVPATADISILTRHFRVVHANTDSCIRGKRLSLFDHLVGAGEQRERDSEAERLGRLEVDDQLDLALDLHPPCRGRVQAGRAHPSLHSEVTHD
jgi:hypothetical protein